MNKRGFSIEWETLFDAIIILFIVFSCVFFVNSAYSGKLLEKQAMAKQVCGLVLAAENNSIIYVDSKDIILEKKGSEIIVKKSQVDFPYSYDCYLDEKVSFERIGDKTKILIQR